VSNGIKDEYLGERLSMPTEAMRQSANERACNRNKPSPTLVPSTAILCTAMAMKDGADKYGPYNWRTGSIPLMEYLDKVLRHIHAYIDGQDCAPDSNLNHLYHAAADLDIIIDSMHSSTLKDNRPVKGASSELIEVFSR
jgi:hypothetical protein